MSPSIEEQIERLKKTIAEMEANYNSLGDDYADTVLVPFQRKLDELIEILQLGEPKPHSESFQQRKLVTVLFMDVVDSTRLALNLDPEDMMAIMDTTLKRLKGPVESHGGHVTRYMGDSFLAVFGAPRSHEDDPEQAVRAGLEIICFAKEIAEDLKEGWNIQGFNVRLGISTGPVMLGGETEAEDTLMGAAVNLAARLENAAPPGTLLISHDTYRHIRGVFDVKPWEPLQVKGFDEAVKVYRILRSRPRAFRLNTRGVEGVETRMIGRDTDLKYLQDALLAVMEQEEGQVVTISGEAGVGKSRLLYEFQNWIELLPPPAVRFFEGRGLQEAQGQPYRLMRDVFEFRFQVQDEDSGEAAREKIQVGFGEVFGEKDEGSESRMRAHIIGQLLGFDFSFSPYLIGVLNDPEQLRNRGLMYLEEYFRGLCDMNPVVMFLEDIHWADDSSLDALNWLGKRLHRKSIMIVCTARNSLLERRPFWGEGLAYHYHINLTPLSKRESHQLVREILKLADQVPGELRDLIVEGAEGNPFFMEELVKMLVEKEVIIKDEERWHIKAGRLNEIEVPPTLAGVLQARLDSLPSQERIVLQQASVVGRQFWDRVVTYIQASMIGQEMLVPDVLNALRRRELIYRREASAFAGSHEYLFKHDILREVTYETVLKRLRRRYHSLVADWLIANSAERLNEFSGSIAEHLLRTGRQEEACHYFLNAGEAALGSYANTEAERFFRQALELYPDNEQETACLAGLGEALSRQGQREAAILVFQQGIERCMELEYIDKVANLYARLSKITWRIDQLEAWKVCQEGLERLDWDTEGPGMARLLAEAGRTAHFQEKPTKEVVSLCQRAIEMAERQCELAAKADAINTIALAINISDLDKSIDLLNESAEFSEENGLWYQAARAYHNLAVTYMVNHLENAVEFANRLYLKTAELRIKIGHIEGLFSCLNNYAGVLIEQGHLMTLEEKLIKILQSSNAPYSRVEELLDEQRSRLFSKRGVWRQALHFRHKRRAKMREGGNFQVIAANNLALVNTYLELNRFTGMDDLSEAESALRDIEKGWEARLSRFRMVVLLSRQERFVEARELLAEALEEIDRPMSIQNNIWRIRAEAELARSDGDWEKAVSDCQTLTETYQKCGFRWSEARRLIDLGDALQGRSKQGDRDQAKRAYCLSLEMFTEMGAPGYIKVLEERLGGI